MGQGSSAAGGIYTHCSRRPFFCRLKLVGISINWCFGMCFCLSMQIITMGGGLRAPDKNTLFILKAHSRLQLAKGEFNSVNSTHDKAV